MKYKNSTGRYVFWEHLCWEDGETKDASRFIPPSVGLELVDREGAPNPVLLCQDVKVSVGGMVEISVPEPLLANRYSCMIQLLSGERVAVRFNTADAPVFTPVDGASAFVATLRWDIAAFLFLGNNGETDADVRVWIGEDV